MEIKFHNGPILQFEEASLLFSDLEYSNVFAQKNNKTLRETINHARYIKLSPNVFQNYSNYLDWPLGKFLFELKSKGDIFYLKFLNKYGDLSYSGFSLNDKSYLNKKGLYAYVVDEKINYIGRCRDSFRKRINQGYGKIHPKNCYLDGQATNCHLNSLINEHKNNVRFFIYSENDDNQIGRLERMLIESLNPPWNISLTTRG